MLQTAGVAASMDTDRYALPTTKIHLEACTKAVLAEHPGKIQARWSLHLNGNFYIRYALEGFDGSEWIVLCDGSTGKIVRAQKLAD